MKIERHNYEEYFLLYIDDELSVDEKKQVDLFVKENPDLEEELVMLQQSRLIPDHTIVFEKKNLLRKDENDSFINLNNYEEWLVLHVDDELKEEDKIIVEKFASAHPHVRQELALFRQTKLEPEKIAFTDKKVLYRREKTSVISMTWWRVTVAAILIIAAGITFYSIFNKRNNNGKISNNEVVNTKKAEAPGHEKSVTPDKQDQTPIIKEEKEQIAVTAPVRKEPAKHKKQPDTFFAVENQIKIDPNTSQKKSDVIAINSVRNTTETKMKNAISFKPQQFFKDSNVTNQLSEAPQPIYVINTESENKKFRGFFRKATRLIERTTNINPADDNNKVLIGGMAINLK